MPLKHFLSELKRRRVFRVAVVYAVVAWVVIQVASDIFPALKLPDEAVTLVVILCFLGFPIALVLGWAFDITPDGVERTEPQVQSPPGPHDADWSRPLPRSRDARRATPPPPPPRNRSSSVHVGDGATEIQAPDPDRVKRASLASLRHELRTPVNAILGYSELLLEDAAAPDQEELAADLQKIHTAGKHILAIVDDILHTEKIAVQKDGGDPDGFREQLRHTIRTPLNAVIGYSEMLIESSRETGREDLLPDLQRILDAARNVLGLVNDIVQISSTDGGQSENSRLSAASLLAQEVLAKIPSLAANSHRDPDIEEGCLLVVDDNGINRDLLARQLARGGYSVRTAKSGREALEMVRSQDFDLVLLDIMMPEIDGLEVLRQLKSDAALSDIPVIMISALDEVDSVIRCIEIGAEDYLSKPFDPVLLKARVGANLQLRRMRDRERAYAEQLSLEQGLSDRLLLSVFPRSVAERLRAGERNIADFSPEATALWAEFDGPTRSNSRDGATDVLRRTGELVSTLEQDARRLGLETFQVTGNTCIIAGGTPHPADDHAEAVAEMALKMVSEVERYRAETGEPLHIRIGLHTGPVTAGVLWTERLAYGLWGDAIDTARRLHSHCTPGSILVSPATYLRLRERYQLQNKGVVEVAGKGQMLTYLLQGKTEPSRSAV